MCWFVTVVYVIIILQVDQANEKSDKSVHDLSNKILMTQKHIDSEIQSLKEMYNAMQVEQMVIHVLCYRICIFINVQQVIICVNYTTTD
jgi:ADP-dependent phosphofructokinase/glucokinase